MKPKKKSKQSLINWPRNGSKKQFAEACSVSSMKLKPIKRKK